MSFIALAFGANWLVKGSSTIATSLGVSQRLFGRTVVTIGTSLPEVVTSVIAAFKREMDISMGNIIGSNIFNILCVIGLTATIQPIPVDMTAFSVDYSWMILFALILFPLIFPFKRWYLSISNKSAVKGDYWNYARLGRFSGVVLILLYALYMYLIF